MADDFCKFFNDTVKKHSIESNDGKKHRDKPNRLSFAEIITIMIMFHSCGHRCLLKGISMRGKCSMGWFFGSKLHLIINEKGEILNFVKVIFGKLVANKGNLKKRAVIESVNDKLSIPDTAASATSWSKQYAPSLHTAISKKNVCCDRNLYRQPVGFLLVAYFKLTLQ